MIHRYVLPFKKMTIPPATNNMFKYRKGAQRLSDWIKRGSSDEEAVGLAQGIIDMQPPAIVAPPPGAYRRNARANVAWGRSRGAQQRRSRLRSVEGDSGDAQETRQVIDAVMQASRAVASTESDDEMAAELEREMAEAEGSGGAGPSQAAGGVPLEDVERMLMEDSDEEAESGDGGDGGGGSSQPSPQGDELSEYELERQENIRRNEARLRELGLLDNPLAPARPPSAPRQPRPPRAPDGPRRASSRLQDLPRPPYADVEHSDDESAEG